MEISELAPLVLIDSKNVKKRQVEDLSEDQIENQKTNKIDFKQTVHHPEWDQTKDQKEYKRLIGNKKEIQDLTWDQTKKKAICEIELPIKVEDSHANIVIKHSVKTFMQLAMKRNRAKKANLSGQKPKSRKKILIHL